MGTEQIRQLLEDARRIQARCKENSTPSTDPGLLTCFDQMIECVGELLSEREQFSGRLRRTSIFTRPVDLADGDGSPSQPSAPPPFPLDADGATRKKEQPNPERPGARDSALWGQPPRSGADHHA
jgi:hypothetical protein